MSLKEIITDMEQNIIALQQQVNVLRMLNIESAESVMLTRQQAADLLGKSLRQLDRDCVKFGIEKEYCNGGVRIRRSRLLMHMGVLSQPNGIEYKSEFERITGKFQK